MVYGALSLLPLRTFGGVTDREVYAFGLYRMSEASLLAGTGTWTQVGWMNHSQVGSYL